MLMLRHTLLQVLLDTPLPCAVSQCLGLCRRLICAAIRGLRISFELSLMHLNIRSIPKNIYMLNNYLLSLDIQFSIIGLMETWLKDETLGLYELPEYKSIPLSRPSRKEYLYTFTTITIT